jgi:hypothetical protein
MLADVKGTAALVSGWSESVERILERRRWWLKIFFLDAVNFQLKYNFSQQLCKMLAPLHITSWDCIQPFRRGS